jgi:cation-transporting ATPase E
MSVVVLTLIALWVLVVLSRPMNVWRVLIIGAMYAALTLVVTVPPLQEFFDLTVLAGEQIAAPAAIAFLGCVAIELLFRHHRRRMKAALTAPA